MHAGSDELWRAILEQRERTERVARARCATREDVDDVVQEAMARVAAMDDVDPERIGALLTVITANLATDVARGRTRRARTVARLAWQRTDQPAHDDAVCDVLEARWLWARRTALPEQDRQVLEMRAQGHTVASAAAALGITYKAAESAYTRARSRMQAVWRATAALAGLLWQPWRRPRGASGAAAVAAVVAVLAIGSAGAPTTPDANEPAQAAPARADLSKPLSPPSSADPVARPARPQVEQLRQDVTGRSRPAAPPLPPPQTVARTPAIDLAGLRTEGGAAVERREGQESMTDTVARCLSEGVIVTLTRIDCDKPPGEPG